MQILHIVLNWAIFTLTNRDQIVSEKVALKCLEITIN